MGYKINIRGGAAWDNILKDINIEVVDSNNNFTGTVLNDVLDELYIGGLTWSVVSSNTTAQSNKAYVANTATANSNITVTLPPSASAGDQIGFIKIGSNYDLIIGRNGKTIQGVAEDLVMDYDNSSCLLVYTDSTYGWRLAWASPAGNSGGSSDPTYTTITSSVSASVGEGYFVNTTSNEITVTLPSTPLMGDKVYITDYNGTFSTYKCIVGRNGNNIMGTAQDMDITTDNISITLYYIDTTVGWKVM